MKVVIFCGGHGVRMGEETRRIPKPMIEIGGKPILWHIMRYYSMWGHDEFILCLGYKGEAIKQFFLSYNGALLNDFVLERDASGMKLDLLSRDLDKWRITFVDTGLSSNIAERLQGGRAAPRRRRGVPRDVRGRPHRRSASRRDRGVPREREDGAVPLGASRSSTRMSSPPTRMGNVLAVEDISRSSLRINGGFFALKRQVVDWIQPGDELVEETFERLIAARELVAYNYDGFFGPMDTIKDRQRLEGLHESGQAPWRRLTPAEESGEPSADEVVAEPVDS